MVRMMVSVCVKDKGRGRRSAHRTAGKRDDSKGRRFPRHLYLRSGRSDARSRAGTPGNCAASTGVDPQPSPTPHSYLGPPRTPHFLGSARIPPSAPRRHASRTSPSWHPISGRHAEKDTGQIYLRPFAPATGAMASKRARWFQWSSIELRRCGCCVASSGRDAVRDARDGQTCGCKYWHWTFTDVQRRSGFPHGLTETQTISCRPTTAVTDRCHSRDAERARPQAR